MFCLISETEQGDMWLFTCTRRLYFARLLSACLSVRLLVCKIIKKLLCRFWWNFACRLPTLQKLIYDSYKNFCDHYKIILWLFTYKKYLLLSQNNFVNIILFQSQNLFCTTNKAFWLYLTKYFVCKPNPNNRIRVTRFQQPGTRFLNWVISQFTIY